MVGSRGQRGSTPYPSGSFGSRIHIDIWKAAVVGHLEVPGTEEAQEFTYVFGIIDSHSKLVKLVNMRTKTAEECADCVLQWCLTYGFPVQITSDMDPSFMGALFQQLNPEHTKF